VRFEEFSTHLYFSTNRRSVLRKVITSSYDIKTDPRLRHRKGKSIIYNFHVFSWSKVGAKLGIGPKQVNQESAELQWALVDSTSCP